MTIKNKNQSHALGVLARYANLQLQGDPALAIHGIATLEKAGPGDLSFYSSFLYRSDLEVTKATAIVLEEKDLKYLSKNPNQHRIACLITPNPRLAMAQIAILFANHLAPETGVHETAVIAPQAQIDPTASIGPHVVIGSGVQIGPHVQIGAGTVIMAGVSVSENARIESRVTIHANVQIGPRTFIHSGAVIGSEGFGFASDQGRWVRIAHLGSVIIGADCEIGSNTSIDRGAIGDTVIEDGVIIDNLVQIAHNVHIGACTAIAGCVAIAGSTKIGKHCLIGGSCSIAGHLTIADGVQITGASAVNRSLNQPGSYSSGFPAQVSEKWRRNVGRFQFLDQLAIKVKTLEKKIDQTT